jgi:predicted tellurium resistance membrane protein TerC
MLIGVMLVAEGVGTPIAKGYIYFAMVFALLVEFLNLRIRSDQKSELKSEPEAEKGN